MLEAVGHENLPTYFGSCYKLLKPNGKMVFQVITMRNINYDTYRKECDFIQKHIFPGGICPSVNTILDAIEKSSKFTVKNMENIGIKGITFKVESILFIYLFFKIRNSLCSNFEIMERSIFET